MVEAADDFVPVFIDTLTDLPQTKRFGERYGSYPVLRVHDWEGNELGGRIDGNKVAGKIPATKVVEQLQRSLAAFEKARENDMLVQLEESGIEVGADGKKTFRGIDALAPGKPLFLFFRVGEDAEGPSSSKVERHEASKRLIREVLRDEGLAAAVAKHCTGLVMDGGKEDVVKLAKSRWAMRRPPLIAVISLSSPDAKRPRAQQWRTDADPAEIRRAILEAVRAGGDQE